MILLVLYSARIPIPLGVEGICPNITLQMWGIYFKKDIHPSSGAGSAKQVLLGDEALDFLG